MTEAEFYRRFRAFWEPIFLLGSRARPFRRGAHADLSLRAAVGDPRDHPGVRGAVEAFQSVTGAAPVVGGAPFSCDLGVYGDPGGMPCLILGPRGDNLHAPDEWVLLEDVYTLTAILADLAVRWSG